MGKRAGFEEIARVPAHAASGAAPSDQDLVARVLDGDGRAFEPLYRRHATVVGRRLHRIVYRADEAADLLQLTFLEAFRSLHRWRPDASFESWLHGIAFRLVGNHIKARRRKWWQLFSPAESGQDAAPSDSDPENQAESREQVAHMYAVLDQLPVKKRVAFCMYEFEGLDLAEIGTLMGVSAQTVWARVESARQELKARLGYSAEPDDATPAARGSTPK